MSHSLDSYFNDDLFKQSSDLDSEIRPILYTPDFSICSGDIDTVYSVNDVNSPTLLGEQREKNQSDGVNMAGAKEFTTHLENPPSNSSNQTSMETASGSAKSERSCAVLNRYFRENSNYTLEIHPEFETNISDRLDKFSMDDLYKQSSDFDSDTKPRLNAPVLNIDSRGFDAVHSANCDDLTNLPGQNQGNNVVVPHKCTTHHTLSQLSRSNAAENQSDSACSQMSNALLNSYFREKSIYHIDDIDQPIACTNIQDFGSESGETGVIRDTPKDHENDGPGGTPQKLSIKVDDRVKLSCPCGKSCERIKSLVTAQAGYMWVSFKQCSWISLYNDKPEKVFMFDTRGSVDSMAVSGSNVLYISCPPQRKILMLSSNLQLTVLRSFTKCYPRGVAVSPDNDTLVVCLTSGAEGYVMSSPSKGSCLMRFKGEIPNKTGKIINKEYHFGYPVKVTINTKGFLLVSDFGLQCLFVLDKGGNMLRKFSSLGGGPLCHVYALTSNPINSFYVIQGGAGTLSITRLGEYLGIFKEKSTSTKEEPLLKQKVETASMATDGQIVIASGNAIIHVALEYSL